MFGMNVVKVDDLKVVQNARVRGEQDNDLEFSQPVVGRRGNEAVRVPPLDPIGPAGKYNGFISGLRQGIPNGVGIERLESRQQVGLIWLIYVADTLQIIHVQG